MNKLQRKRIPAFLIAVVILLYTMTASAVPVAAASQDIPLKAHTSIGYWLGGNGGTNKTLGQMDKGWDVINVSFIETRGNNYTPFLIMDLSAVYPGSEAQQKEAFIADMRMLQAEGKKIVISCGGQNGVVHLDNIQQRDVFLAGLIAIIDEYGFDGFDVDFEGSSIACMNPDRIGDLKTQQSIHLAYILRALKERYGAGFIISAAPEYCYVQGGAISVGNFGAFLPVLDDIRDILTYIHPQYYNGFNGDFAWLQPDALAGPAFPQVYSEEGYFRLSEMLITGFQTMDKGYFEGLRPDQVAFGVPARTGAGNGAQSPSVYAAALARLLEKYDSFRGVMTWSIGWDESGGNQFIKAVDPVIERANGGLTHAAAPVILDQPDDSTAEPGETVRLTLAASVTKGNLSYQWYQSSSNVNVGGTLLAGQTSPAITISADTEGTSYYYCIITNTDLSAAGNTTASVTSRAAAVTAKETPVQPTAAPTDAPEPTDLPEPTDVPEPTDTPQPTVTPGEGDTWKADVVYVAGDTVIYQGKTYLCKWWSLGNIPTAGGPWELQAGTEPGSGADEYIPGRAYTGGEEVTYQGQNWRAKWWTTAVPGTDDSWQLIS